MKKILIFLIPFFFLLFPLSVKASYLPPIAPTNTNTVVDFIVSSAMTDLAQNGVRVADKNAFDTLNNIINGHNISSSVQSSFVDLDGSSSWLTSTLWRSDGSSVLPQDAYMALVETDAGTATAIYAKDNAEMLLIGDTWGSAESTLISGVLSSNQTHRFPLTEPVLTQRISNNGVFTSPTLTNEVKEEFESYAFSGYMRSTSQGFICFIPNGCTVNTRILPINGQYTYKAKQTYFDKVYFDYVTNAPSEIIFNNPNNSQYATSVARTTTYAGKTFSYVPRWSGSFNVLYSGGEVYFHAPTNAEYNALSNEQVVYTEPCTDNSNVTNEYYSYTLYNNTYPTYRYFINNNYDYNEPTSPENYPRNSTVTTADYSPTYNYYNEYITYQDTPQIGGNIGTLDPNEITNGLPILNNLSKRFPFSIPWDIYNILSSLSAERETPYINTDVTIPAINYVWHIEYDLSDFDEIASLFRKLFLISFIVGLAWFSYDHFFGE